MKTGVLKLTALSVVLGIGVLLVMQAQRSLEDKKNSTETDAEGEGRLGAEVDEQPEGDDPPSDPDPTDVLQAAGRNDADDDIVPAAQKLGRTSRPQPRRPSPAARRRLEADDDVSDDDRKDSEPPSESLVEPVDEPDSPRRSSNSRRSTEKPSLKATRLKSVPSDSGPQESADEFAEDDRFPLDDDLRAHKSVKSKTQTKIGGLKDDEVASDETTEEPAATVPASRELLDSPGKSAGGLRLPDDDEEDDAALNRATPSILRSRGRVVPVAGELDDKVNSTEEEAGLGSNLADSDDEFKPREKPDSDSTRSTNPPARSRFTDDDEEESESVADGSDTATSAPEETGTASDSGHSDSPDETGSTKSRFVEEDEPLGGDDSKSSVSEEPAETAPRNPAKSPQTIIDEEDDETLIDQRKDRSPEESPAEKDATKSHAGGSELETDDDPLSIHTQPKRTIESTPGGRREPAGRQPTGVVEDPEEAGEPAAPRRPRPRLTIEKKAPDTAVIGRPMVYEIVVRNAGPVPARGVTVEDVVPAGVRIDGSKPQGQLDGRRLSWRLGLMEPGSTQTIAVRVTPQSEGTVGGVATVHFDSEKEGATRNGPRLQVSVDAPRKATVGQTVQVTFKVRNVGPTDAVGVLIHDVLPAALRHPQGDDLEYEIGDIPPGGVREVQLQLTAAQAGQATNRAVITADGAVSEETVVQLEVVGPALTVARTGTKKLYPGKKGRFTNTVTNPTASLMGNVTVVETIPAGLEFLDATDNGQYDPTRRTVTWLIGSLEPRESRSVSVSLNSSGRGSQISVVRASDSSGASGEAVGTTQIVGTPALSVEVPELPGSIDAGQEIQANVRVYNRGTDSAANSRITISIPATLELVSIEGPTRYQRTAAGGAKPRTEIRFDPIRAIDVKKFADFKLVLKGRTAGSGRLRVQAACDQAPEPIQREDDLTVVAE